MVLRRRLQRQKAMESWAPGKHCILLPVSTCPTFTKVNNAEMKDAEMIWFIVRSRLLCFVDNLITVQSNRNKAFSTPPRQPGAVARHTLSTLAETIPCNVTLSIFVVPQQKGIQRSNNITSWNNFPVETLTARRSYRVSFRHEGLSVQSLWYVRKLYFHVISMLARKVALNWQSDNWDCLLHDNRGRKWSLRIALQISWEQSHIRSRVIIKRAFGFIRSNFNQRIHDLVRNCVTSLGSWRGAYPYDFSLDHGTSVHRRWTSYFWRVYVCKRNIRQTSHLSTAIHNRN